MIDLSGRKALVTGGSRGIGRATVLLLARAGCDVAFNFVHRPDAADEVKVLVQKMGRECLAVKAELAREQDARRLVEAPASRWGRVDILVNNAGIWTYGEIGAMPARVWEETMKVNLDGVFFVTNAVVPLMKAQRWGRIINVSSTAAVRGEAFHSHYAGSKGALHSLTKSWAAELGPYNINVNCVAPGWVETDMCTESFSDPEFRRSVEQSIPLRRIPPPEDIAGPILFLASDLARHITGAIINVNGGGVLSG
jgi:3-oxoacyl-[acyl-carrier protein] reductase